MSGVLDIPEIRDQVAPISIERYHRMIDLGIFDEWKVELLNGVHVKKMSKSELRLFLVDLLMEMLSSHCSGSEFWVRKEDPITIEDSEPEPDVSVVRGSRAKFRHTKPTTAQLVIEVAVSSLSLDRAKGAEYPKAKVPEYWIVRPEHNGTEVYRAPLSGVFSQQSEVSAEAELESSALPGFSFCLEAALAE